MSQIGTLRVLPKEEASCMGLHKDPGNTVIMCPRLAYELTMKTSETFQCVRRKHSSHIDGHATDDEDPPLCYVQFETIVTPLDPFARGMPVRLSTSLFEHETTAMVHLPPNDLNLTMEHVLTAIAAAAAVAVAVAQSSTVVLSLRGAVPLQAFPRGRVAPSAVEDLMEFALSGEWDVIWLSFGCGLAWVGSCKLTHKPSSLLAFLLAF
jgi:hypothetical protein